MTVAFITGLGGFVGSHLAEYLARETDWQITGTVRFGEPLDNLGGLLREIHTGRVVPHDLDVTDASATARVLRGIHPDYVFHLAAQSFPVTSFANPAMTLQTNIMGTLSVLEGCRACTSNPWIQICSSAEVYGKTSGTLTESSPFHPASPYSVSKIGADLLGQLYASYGMNVVITRMFTHTGPRRGDVFAESTFAKQIAMIEAKKATPPIMVGNLHSVRTVADVRDAVRAYHMALTVDPQKGAIYNIGGARTCSVREILYALFEAAGARYDLMTDPTRLRIVDADCQIPDTSAFTAHTGWRPKISFEKTIADLLAYWRDRVRHSVVLQR
jgi:GDP-mannose 4,6-dehydratase